MEVILLEDVKSLGKKGDVVKVSDGYARNYILPKKMGLEATQKNLNDLKLQKAAEERRQKEIYEEAKQLAEKIQEGMIILTIKSGEGGRTFGSVSTKEIASAIKEQMGYEIDKKKLTLAEPLKNVGTFTVPIKLHPKVTAQLKVQVKGI